VIHLIAIAGRVGLKVTLEDWDRLGRNVPTLVDLMPSGRFLMEDFYYAGGLPAVIRALGQRNLIHRDVLTVNGKTIWENCETASNWNSEVIRPLEKPLVEHGGIAVLRGNLAPDGAVLKPSAASPQLMRHRGRAIVFENIEHYKERIDNPELEVDETCVLVLKNCGPKGYPGMAEVGNMSLPAKLLKRGITDMVRISDARMSGTAYGTVVLHVCPEAAVGGTLALVRDGDFVEIDVKERRIHLDVSQDELDHRRDQWEPPAMPMKGGYQQLYVERVMQANTGADLDFLIGCRGDDIPRESH
jgi:dihydroxyacid dehydratase/phosphogluconate dehydratase